ncbi:MAG: Ig-like domain-containing protein [Candidatus Zixiibacteriota bacterium]
MSYSRVKPIRPVHLFSVITFVAAAILLACAEVAPPPGGEVDRTGPQLIESYPAAGALGVEVGYQIRLTFSETIVKPEQGGAVYISPRPAQPPQIKWEKDRVVINLAEGFLSNQTYVVSISTAISDLRRNRLDSAVTLAFSTGQSIDSGVVTGSVATAENKPAAGWTVALFDQGTLGDYHLIDSVYPDYLTTVSGAGQFRLQYLPDRSFDLIAFEDKNRDELFNPAAESFALPDREIAVGVDVRLDRLHLVGTDYDSLAPAILSATATKDRLLRVRLNRKIDPAYMLSHLGETIMSSLANTAGPALACEGIAESGVELTDIVTAYFPGLADGAYRLSLTYRDGMPPLTRDSVLIKLQSDDVLPEIVSFRPGDRPVFVNQVEVSLAFSEPVARDKIGDQTFTLWEGEATLSLRQTWDDPFRLRLDPERLNAGSKYRLDVTEFDIRDLSGNALGDSLRSYNFATLDDDSVGSISGRIVVALPDKNRQTARLSFAEVESKREFPLKVEASQTPGVQSESRDFAINVPPGMYLLSGYLDSNGDGKLTPGSIRPYHLAETVAILTDTITVRARFETAEIELKFE